MERVQQDSCQCVPEKDASGLALNGLDDLEAEQRSHDSAAIQINEETNEKEYIMEWNK